MTIPRRMAIHYTESQIVRSEFYFRSLRERRVTTLFVKTCILPEFIYQLSTWQTVILDSCYSSSGTRGKLNIHPVLDHTFKARSIDVKCTIPSDIDQGVWGSRASKIVSSFDFKGLRSHNLLAASHSDQLAYERFGRGVFTLALIETLVKHGIDNLTYANILSRMLPLSSGWV